MYALCAVLILSSPNNRIALVNKLMELIFYANALHIHTNTNIIEKNNETIKKTNLNHTM